MTGRGAPCSDSEHPSPELRCVLPNPCKSYNDPNKCGNGQEAKAEELDLVAEFHWVQKE